MLIGREMDCRVDTRQCRLECCALADRGPPALPARDAQRSRVVGGASMSCGVLSTSHVHWDNGHEDNSSENGSVVSLAE
jgi:hypothetical protein